MLIDVTDEMNMRFGTPHDLKTKTVVNFAAGLIRSTLLSPYVADEFLLAGFKMITDPTDPMMAVANLDKITEFLQ